MICNNGENCTSCSQDCGNCPVVDNCACNSCADCTSKLKGTCSIVKLSNNINFSSGTCINQPAYAKTFDCQNYSILKNVYNGNGYGIYLTSSSGFVSIKNCKVNNLGIGAYLYNANQVSISNSQFDRNKYGIYMYKSNGTKIESSSTSNNTYYGIYLASNLNSSRISNLNSCANNFDIYSISSSAVIFSNTQCRQNKTYGVPIGTCVRNC